MAHAPSAPGLAGLGPAAQAQDMTEAMRRGRRRLMVAGVLFVILGLVAIAVPAVASVATAIFIGWILITGSAFLAMDAFAARHGGRTAVRLLLALLTFAAGLYLVVAPLQGTFTLTVMLVIWFVAIGVARLIAGLSERGVPGAGMTALLGVVDLVLGILIAEGLPEAADWAVGLIVGVDLLFSGAVLIALARGLGRLESLAG